MNYKLFKQSQKMRVIIDGIHIHTTAKQIRNGIGDSTTQNAAVQKAVCALEGSRSDGAVGLVGAWEGHQVQVSLM
jgi:GTP cyclohydrolase III